MALSNAPALLSVIMPGGTRYFRVILHLPRDDGDFLAVVSTDGQTYGTYPATLRRDGSVMNGHWFMVSAHFIPDTGELILKGYFRSE